ncbi:MAG: hypothetical protein QM778_29330 [Myxococcales bacterium]
MRRTLISLFLAALSLMVTAQASARPFLDVGEELDDPTKLTLARAMVGEADWHAPDHVAIAFVLAKRWPIYRTHHPEATFQQYIALYSSPLRRDLGARSAWLRSLPWGPIEGPYAQRWDQVRALVERFSQGKLRDPCPGAMHWGGAMDRPAAGMRPVSCGYTRNIFYGLRAPSSSVSKLSKASAPKATVLLAASTKPTSPAASNTVRERED